MKPNQPSYDRYQRQMLLKEFGEGGQQKLLHASVLVVGAGGLGCPALQYLVAAGIGRIGIVDDDKVAMHNLHRQVLFTTEDIGRPKTEAAAKRLAVMNPDVSIEIYADRLNNQNAASILETYDIILDATDNFASRYLINDACVLLGKTLVYGAISQYEGQVAVFNASSSQNATNYRDLFPQPPPPGSVLNCAEAGVLGVLPGIIGTMQATEVLKLVAGIGKPLINQLFTYNALTSQTYVFDIKAREETPSLMPKTIEDYQLVDYGLFCNSSGNTVDEIDVSTFNDFMKKKDVVVIDVREQNEKPEVDEFTHLKLPLSVLQKQVPAIEQNTVILFCQSGKRSGEAAKILSAKFDGIKKVYSLKGGILHWKQIQHGEKEA